MFVVKEERCDYHTSNQYCATQRHRDAAEQNKLSHENDVNYVTQGKLWLVLQQIQ